MVCILVFGLNTWFKREIRAANTPRGINDEKQVTKLFVWTDRFVRSA